MPQIAQHSWFGDDCELVEFTGGKAMFKLLQQQARKPLFLLFSGSDAYSMAERRVPCEAKLRPGRSDMISRNDL
ncbi:hypothetical protein HED49_17985 [Ochrobactrum daejeonense]|nr:hypothetical protein [Brucella daejeonensis]